MSAHILLVEDEEKLARFVELELMHEGYQVTKSGNGREALEIATKEDFDLILLDIMLPGLNGLEVLRRLQKEKEVSVILLTARDAVMDKVAGLDAGAVDYITKPFAIEELLARIRVALKFHALSKASQGVAAGGIGRENDGGSGSASGGSGNGMERGASGEGPMAGQTEKEQPQEGVLTWGELRLDTPRHQVKYAGHEIFLTNREFLMLKTLLENKDIVLSRDTLLNRVCGYEFMGETNIVDVYIRYLRSKIDDVFGIKMIHTIRGVGYVIKAETDTER